MSVILHAPNVGMDIDGNSAKSLCGGEWGIYLTTDDSDKVTCKNCLRIRKRKGS